MKHVTLALCLGLASAGCTVSDVECYADDLKHRVFPTMALDGGMTQQYCAQLCFNKKMAMAGVEFSTQCFCGNTIPTDAKKSTKCTMACGADKSEMCGGYDAISIFKVDCSGEWAPKFFPNPYIY
jgi:hypothetical protein